MNIMYKKYRFFIFYVLMFIQLLQIKDIIV